MIIFGNIYTSTKSGVRLQQVHCRQCGGFYFYEMLRFAAGKGSSLFMLDNTGGQRRALRNASWELQSELESGVDPVPCAHCGHLQPEMLREVLPGRPLPIPGMPPALVWVEEDGVNGEPPVQYLATGRPQEVSTEKGNVDVQLSRIELPAFCCVCAVPTDTRYRVPLRISEDDRPLRVPTCEACQQVMRQKVVLAALVGWLVALSAGIVLSVVIPGIDTIARIFLLGIVGLLGGLVLMYVFPAIFATPYKYLVADEKRGILRLRFASATYTELVAATAKQSANSGQVFRDLMADMQRNLEQVVE